MPELIDHGVTGFLVDSQAEAVAAIARIGEIDRATVRRVAAERFGVEAMAEAYMGLYRQVIAERRTSSGLARSAMVHADSKPPVLLAF